MLKRLPAWAKCLLGGGALVGAIVFMTYEEQRAAVEYERACQEGIALVGTSASKKQASGTEECQGPKKYMPWWYILVAWPEGITTWAIIGTGFVIAWQSYETRKSAQIAKRALILEFRPKIILRGLKLTPIDPEHNEVPDWKIEMTVANTGGSTAYIKPWSLKSDWYDLPGDQVLRKLGEFTSDGFTLPAGGSQRVAVNISTEGFRISMHTLRFSVQGLDKRQYKYPAIYGTISYLDDNRIKRNTGFWRIWDAKNDRFAPSTDPELEYQD
jgi:hypothetical protein